MYGKEVEAGSTTVCMAKVWPGVSKGFEAISKEAWMSDTKPAEVDEYVLEVANIGDSGLIVLRPTEGDAQSTEDGQKPVCIWAPGLARVGGMSVVWPALCGVHPCNNATPTHPSTATIMSTCSPPCDRFSPAPIS